MPHTRLPSCFSVHVAGWNRITIAPGRRLNPFVCRTLASSVISVQQVGVGTVCGTLYLLTEKQFV